MIDKKELIAVVERAIADSKMFVVDVTVSGDNVIDVALDSMESITIDDCIAVNDAVHAAFDQDVEDYALTVSSAGLDRPFKVFRQYLKALGTQVDVKFRGGKRLIATLVAATEETVTLHYKAMEAVEGKKKKEKVEHEECFPLAEINSVTPYVEFK